MVRELGNGRMQMVLEMDVPGRGHRTGQRQREPVVDDIRC